MVGDETHDGSSPHTRGAPARQARARASIGIIPAYAGSTRRRRRSASSSRDHPRIRGEHPAHYVLAFRHAGSSPHTRGAQGIGEICTKLGRIIPAYAGSTRSAPILMTLLSDHPRIRGEHGRAPSEKMRFLGSSPHTRGALSVSPGGALSCGSSPHTRGARTGPG